MKLNDILSTMFIFLIFILLAFYSVLTIGFNRIEDDFDKYRCDPIIMPFVSSFGRDPMQNLYYCVQNMNSNYSQYITGPLQSAANLGTDAMGQVGGSLNNISEFLSVFQSESGGAMGNITGMMQNLIIAIMKMFLSCFNFSFR